MGDEAALMEHRPNPQWVEAVVEGICYLSASLLEGCTVEPGDEFEDWASDVTGEFIQLDVGTGSFLIGLAGPDTSRQAIACKMCMMEEEDDNLDPPDVTDALGEIVNVIAGHVKTRLCQTHSSIQLGLPTMLGEEIGSLEHSGRHLQHVEIEGHRCVAVIIELPAKG